MKYLRRLPLILMMVVLALLFLAPVCLIFVTSFKSEQEILEFGSLFPQHWTWENYTKVLSNSEEIPIFRWLINSLFISSSVTLLVLTVSSLAAFALARLRPPGGRMIYTVIIGTMMVPGQILLVPVYLIMNWLGWLDTPAALIVPAGAGGFGVFLLHQFFKGIPDSLEESIEMDGGGAWHKYIHVALPLSRAALATLGIFTFIGTWNDFMGPLIFLDSLDNYTLPVGIALFQTSYYNDYGLTLAASGISVAPAIVLFLIFQKQIMKGIALTGLKE